MQNISKPTGYQTFARELRQAVQDQREIKRLQNNLNEFKDKYGDILGEGEHYKLESGEQFRKTTSTPSSKKSKLDQDKAMAWFIDAMREKRVTRKEFNAIAINHNGRKASLIIEMK
jgi:hypothetical protein|tara:strand:- start:394 stop:741 length:348 start_codon:yes stop_codon:yes gene_type:complete